MRHEIHIDNWLPHTLNQLLRVHWAQRNRMKASDKQMIAVYGLKVPKATGKRRVSLIWTLGKGGKRVDEDNTQKSILDALVACGLLRDDSAKWLEWGGVTFNRAATKALTIILEDLPDGV